MQQQAAAALSGHASAGLLAALRAGYAGARGQQAVCVGDGVAPLI